MESISRPTDDARSVPESLDRPDEQLVGPFDGCWNTCCILGSADAYPFTRSGIVLCPTSPRLPCHPLTSGIPGDALGISRKGSRSPRDALSLWFRQRNGSGSECRLLKLDHDSFRPSRLVDICSPVRRREFPGIGTELPANIGGRCVKWNEGSDSSVTPSHDIGVVGSTSSVTSLLYDAELHLCIFSEAGRRAEAKKSTSETDHRQPSSTSHFEVFSTFSLKLYTTLL